jgi:hypothetical protein
MEIEPEKQNYLEQDWGEISLEYSIPTGTSTPKQKLCRGGGVLPFQGSILPPLAL